MDQTLVKVNNIVAQLTLSHKTLESICEKFIKELNDGLKGKSSMLKMLPTFITHLPLGDEAGEFLVVDLGGSNLRVGLVKLKGKGQFELDRKKWQLGQDFTTGDSLFSFIAECIKDYITTNNVDVGRHRCLGFTFSYPVNQRGLAHGELIQWNKALKCDDVIGKDVVRLLEEAMHKLGLDIKVGCLLNDTVGTLAAHSYCDPDTKIGVILGTGTNAAYVEDCDNLRNKLDNDIQADKMLVNIEWGAFGDGKGREYLPLTSADIKIDAETVNPGKQAFEKMVSGMYLGEVARLLLKEADLDVSEEPFSLSTVELSKIACAMSDTESVSHEDKICKMVVQRSAQLCAAALVAIYRAIGSPKERTVVAFDGSLYQHYPGYDQMLRDAIKQLEPLNTLDLQLAKDRSILGAAVVLASHY